MNEEFIVVNGLCLLAYVITTGVMILMVMKVYLQSTRKIRTQTRSIALGEAAGLADAESFNARYSDFKDAYKKIADDIRKLKQE